jgi:hypothetical protein
VSNDPTNATDPSGLKIVTWETTINKYLEREQVKFKQPQLQKGIAFNTWSYNELTEKPGFAAGNLRSEILADMIRSPREFILRGITPQEVLNNLERQVRLRVATVEATKKVPWALRPTRNGTRSFG